jgi:hypothetical protein
VNPGAPPPAAPLRLAALAALLAGLAASAVRAEPAAAALDLETLMRHFAASRGVEAEFREEKTLPLLALPLRSEGVIYFAPPDRMLRVTRSPEAGSLLVAGDRLRMEDALGVEEIDLAAQPAARRFVDQLLLLFRGDLAGLEREYHVAFEAQGERWSLRLTARSRQVRQLVREVTLRGEKAHLDEMVVTGTDGDVTRTRYSRVVSDRAFADDELAALFPAQGSPSPPALVPAAR